MKKHRESRVLTHQVKIMLNEEMYKKVGEESARTGLSIAEIFRRSYEERGDT